MLLGSACIQPWSFTNNAKVNTHISEDIVTSHTHTLLHTHIYISFSCISGEILSNKLPWVCAVKLLAQKSCVFYILMGRGTIAYSKIIQNYYFIYNVWEPIFPKTGTVQNNLKPFIFVFLKVKHGISSIFNLHFY